RGLRRGKLARRLGIATFSRVEQCQVQVVRSVEGVGPRARVHVRPERRDGAVEIAALRQHDGHPLAWSRIPWIRLTRPTPRLDRLVDATDAVERVAQLEP